MGAQRKYYQTTRFNRTLNAMIRGFTNESQTNWDEYIHLLSFAHGSLIHSSMGISPFMELYGREPRLPCDPVNNTEDSLLSINYY
ncbi:hypothetical protein AYI69_g9233 [Smittium culicis]|uniref:Integrase catalytic domain-containing protein n=1 Tax=Smittium culicis TaxID=133412 RepID=A0A1R1XE02_9FUNG|nr:hypothetical protein AYI69_g9233 [Smittium culicis]